MEIGIIGYGVVGRAVSNTLSNTHDLTIYDKYEKFDNFTDLNKCDFVFIMVPTPFDCQSNLTDDSAIIESLEGLDKMGYSNIVVIKSTISPGSCQRYSDEYGLKIVFNPEFLRESSTPNEDFENQRTVVIGTDSLEVFDSVKKMYEEVLLPEAEYYHTSLKEAEMIKCSQNAMLASRVALANMIYDACEDCDIGYDKIRKIAFDKFDILGPHMVQVPGPDGKRGFGGKCLPKDIRTFSTVCNSDLLNVIIKYNDSLRDDMDKLLVNFDAKD